MNRGIYWDLYPAHVVLFSYLYLDLDTDNFKNNTFIVFHLNVNKNISHTLNPELTLRKIILSCKSRRVNFFPIITFFNVFLW